MPSESGEWSYGVVRDLRNIWATEKTKSRSPTPSTKLPTYTHVTSQPTRGDTFLGVLVQSGLADMGELIYCSLSHRGFYGRISHAETDALLEDCSEDRGVWTYSTPPWTFPMLVRLLQPLRLSPVFSNIVWPWASSALPIHLFTSNGICFLEHTLRNADPWSIKRPYYGRKKESA